MFYIRYFRRLLTTALLFAAALTACGNIDPLGPDSQTQVVNSVDGFLLQVWSMDDGTETLTYDWDNTGTQATVEITQSISVGSALLTIKDNAGSVVHQDEITNDNDTDTSVGIAGAWTIEVQIQNATGTFSVRVVKKTES